MAQTAAARIVAPTSPTQITSGSLNDGAVVITYNRCGNLLFNIKVDRNVGPPDSEGPIGAGDAIGHGNLDAAADRIASLLGTTVNTLYYTQQSAPAPNSWQVLYYNAGWSAAVESANVRLGQGILVN